ncbi:hypothetical protein B0A48_10214 [Cryoendolithus antarcticus]|uniref:Thioredoxin domain-containing protein n=1 Tax=Cryoendolithus antarcticus TaxID=1507870 RepID=A0A1V8SWX1_9PEZI|nr:hypothetical protein B0A48_10214 [Cryoendolithus antarcticus]
MGAHTELTSKADFDKALETTDKYVLVYAYEGEVSPQAESYATKFASTVDSYKLDISKYPEAAKFHGISSAPSIVVYKSGKEVSKVEGVVPEKMKELGEMLSKGV